MNNDRFKFKVLDTTTNKFLEETEADYFYIDFEGNLCIEHISCHNPIRYANTDYKAIQCTGLKDKNGDLIYEGHIVKTKLFCGDGCSTKWLIKNSNTVEAVKTGIQGCLCRWYGKGVFEVTYEIIGNIYENPELLED